MEFNEDNSPKFLVPEVVQRSRSFTTLKKGLEDVAPRVEKVYQSKKRYDDKLRKHNENVLEEGNALQQKENSLTQKQTASMRHFFRTVGQTDRVKKMYTVVEEETAQLVEDFEAEMSGRDSVFIETFRDFDQEHVSSKNKELEKEIRELQVNLEKIRNAGIDENAEKRVIKLAMSRALVQQMEAELASALMEEKQLKKKISDLKLELVEAESHISADTTII